MRSPRWIASVLAVVASGCSTPPAAPNGTAPGGWTLEVTAPEMSVNTP
ncbi:MAG: hypothetical protein ABI828_05830 [Actinomycetota bacterium]